MRQVLYLIVEVNNEHVKELVDSTYPILMGPEKNQEYSDERNKFLRDSNLKAANRMNKMCNKILDFLADIKMNTIVHNPEYIQLQSSTNAKIVQRKETLEAWIRDLPLDEGFQELLNPKALRAEKLFLDVIHYRNGMKEVWDQVIHVVETLSERNVVDLTADDVDEVLKESDFEPSLNENQKKRTLALVAKYKSEILNESHSTENLQEVSIIRSSERPTRKPGSYSSHLTTFTSSAFLKRKRKQTPKVQITKTSAFSKRNQTPKVHTSAVSKRKASHQIVQQKAKTVRVHRRGNDCSKSEAAEAAIVDGPVEDRAVSSLQEEEPARTSFHASSREGAASLQVQRQNKRRISIFLDAEVDAEEEEVISSSENHSSLVDGTREDQAEADAEVEAGQALDLTSFNASLAEAAVHAGGDREEVEAGQTSRVDEASVLKPPPSVSDRDDAHLCLILDSFTTQLMDWDLNDEDLLLFGRKILSFVEDNSDVNSFSEFQSFLLKDDSISRTQLVSTTSSLPNAPPVDEEKETDRFSPSQVSFQSQTLSTILEEPDYSLLNTLGRPWKEGNSIGSGITRVTDDERFLASLNYDIIATCLVRAFVQLSLPTEYKHPRWREIGDCLRYCLSKIYQDSDNIWVHVSPDMLGIISSMHLQLGGVGIKLSTKQRSRRGDNALLHNQTSTKDSTSKFQQSIQNLIVVLLSRNMSLFPFPFHLCLLVSLLELPLMNRFLFLFRLFSSGRKLYCKFLLQNIHQNLHISQMHI